MKKTLKLGKVLSAITMVVSIVAAFLCFSAVVFVLLGKTGEIAKVGNTTIYGLLPQVNLMEKPYLLVELIIYTAYNIASAVCGHISKKFFAWELLEDVLFSSESVKRCRKTGIMISVVSIVAMLACGVFYIVSGQEIADHSSLCQSSLISCVIGIGFIVASGIMDEGCREIKRAREN